MKLKLIARGAYAGPNNESINFGQTGLFIRRSSKKNHYWFKPDGPKRLISYSVHRHHALIP